VIPAAPSSKRQARAAPPTRHRPERVAAPRTHQVFERLIGRCKALEPIRTAVAYPMSEVALLGAADAAREQLIAPVLLGPKRAIESLARQVRADLSSCEVVDVEEDRAAAAQAVVRCRSGDCEALMKGSLHTDHLMHAVMAETTGLRTARRISHVFVFDVPAYPRTLLVTDAAINI